MVRCRILVAVVVVACVSVGRAADLAGLEALLPPEANTIAIVRVEEILKSPRAVREGWAKSADEAFLAGALTLPSQVSLLVRGTHLQAGHAAANWSVAFLKFAAPIDMRNVAAHERSTIQTIAGKPATLSRRNVYFAQIDTQILGVISPAVRQKVSRLIQAGAQATGGKPRLSDYLTEAAGDTKSQIVLAIDLAEMFEPDVLKARIAATSTAKSRISTTGRLTELCMALRGIRLGITVGEQMDARLSVDFGIDVGKDGNAVKFLLLEVLGDLGASIDALEKCQVTAQGKSVQLTAKFEDEDLRRVMSLATSPHAGVMEKPAETPSVSDVTPRVSSEASRKYFKAIDQILSDLQKANARAKDYAKTATWHANFADKIDQLSTTSVDEQLIQFGQFVSAHLRALAASLQGEGINVNTIQQTLTYNNVNITPSTYNGGLWVGSYTNPWVTSTNNLETVREKQADAIRAGAKDRDQVWVMIGDERAKVYDAMKQKFGPEFEKAAAK